MMRSNKYVKKCVNAFKIDNEYYFCDKDKLLAAKLVKKDVEKTAVLMLNNAKWFIFAF